MTDDQIRAWLEKKPVFLSHDSITDCLTELLAHRELHRSIKYAVWVRDQSAESGWKCCGWFVSEEEAQEYRFTLLDEPRMADAPEPELLVLPFQERPCLTAR